MQNCKKEILNSVKGRSLGFWRVIDISTQMDIKDEVSWEVRHGTRNIRSEIYNKLEFDLG